MLVQRPLKKEVPEHAKISMMHRARVEDAGFMLRPGRYGRPLRSCATMPRVSLQLRSLDAAHPRFQCAAIALNVGHA